MPEIDLNRPQSRPSGSKERRSGRRGARRSTLSRAARLAGATVAVNALVRTARPRSQRAVSVDGALADELRRPDGLAAGKVVQLGDDSAASLAAAYGELSPGAPVVLSVPRRPVMRERVRSELFAQGFERPKVLTAGDRFVISALRSEGLPPALRRHRLSVVVPVYNERATFSTMMKTLVDKEIEGVDIDIVVVESNSTDGTRDEVLSYADHARVTVVLQEAARGKGNAVRAGLERATGDFVLVQDADLEYDMDDYEVLLQPLQRFEAGFVLGARRAAGHTWRIRHFGGDASLALLMNVGHQIFLALFNAVYRQKLHDPFTMYKLFRRDAIFGLNFECDRFDFDWELTAKLVRAGYTPLELPVTYHSRSFGEGKKVSLVRDPLTWVTACFKYRFSRLYADR